MTIKADPRQQLWSSGRRVYAFPTQPQGVHLSAVLEKNAPVN